MWVTNEQAAEIYARFCQARYGSDAMRVIGTRVAELRRLGDREGEQIWNLVAQKVEAPFGPRLHSAA